MAQEFVIEACSGGFGEYQINPNSEDIEYDRGDLVAGLYESGDEVYEIGRDELPDYVDDIRGRIHNEPDGTLYALVYNADDDERRTVSYHMVAESDND